MRSGVDGHEAVLGELAPLDPQVRAQPVEQRLAARQAFDHVVREQHAIAAGR
jgi:hypothetical protein